MPNQLILKKWGLLFLLLFACTAFGQINILNSTFTTYNVTPRSLCELSIMNNQDQMEVYIEAGLYTPSNELILSVKTSPFTIQKGLNTTSTINLVLISTIYSSTPVGQHVKTTKSLPSGKYKFCSKVVPVNTDFNGDDYCDEIESEVSGFLMLVSPYDKDTIDTKNPLLVWNHSEPFSLMSSGEYYRLMLVEMKEGQNAESAINVNVPHYMKNYLHDHQVLYPFDAKELADGKRYAWQVQRMTNGVITNKSEAWEFVLAKKREPKDNKYTRLSKTLDGGYYLAENENIFFRFDESHTAGKMKAIVYNTKRKATEVEAVNLDAEVKDNQDGLRTNGHNRFQVDLKPYNLKNGFYTLEVTSTNGEKYVLKFLVKK